MIVATIEEIEETIYILNNAARWFALNPVALHGMADCHLRTAVDHLETLIEIIKKDATR